MARRVYALPTVNGYFGQKLRKGVQKRQLFPSTCVGRAAGCCRKAMCRTSSWMLREGDVSDERLDAAGKRRGCGRRMVGTFERATERRRMSDRDARGDVGLMCREVCLGLCVMSLACPSSLRACVQGVILLQFLITHAKGTSVCQWPRGAAGRGMKLRRGLTNGERNGKDQSADPA